MRGRWQPRGWSTFLSGRRASNCSQTGSMMYGGTAGMERLLQFGKLQQLPEMIGQSMSVYIQIPSLLAQALSRGEPNIRGFTYYGDKRGMLASTKPEADFSRG